jgi:hypothetical protein
VVVLAARCRAPLVSDEMLVAGGKQDPRGSTRGLLCSVSRATRQRSALGVRSRDWCALGCWARHHGRYAALTVRAEAASPCGRGGGRGSRARSRVSMRRRRRRTRRRSARAAFKAPDARPMRWRGARDCDRGHRWHGECGGAERGAGGDQDPHLAVRRAQRCQQRGRSARGQPESITGHPPNRLMARPLTTPAVPVMDVIGSIARPVLRASRPWVWCRSTAKQNALPRR